MDEHFGAFLKICSQETASTTQEDSQPEPSKQDQQRMVNLPTTQQGHIAIARSPLRRGTASGQMHQYHLVGLKAAADPQPANSNLTIEVTADTNTVAGLPIDPEGDQESDPSADSIEVISGTEGAQEILLIHIPLEGITQAEGPDPGSREDEVTVPEAMMVPDFWAVSARDRTSSPHKVNIELN